MLREPGECERLCRSFKQSLRSWFSDPEDAEVLSTTSDPEEPEEPEVEDEELKVAAQHLTQDFLCQVIQEEEGRDRKTGAFNRFFILKKI